MYRNGLRYWRRPFLFVVVAWNAEARSMMTAPLEDQHKERMPRTGAGEVGSHSDSCGEPGMLLCLGIQARLYG